jgi:protein-S-isoprenylcysteine O-methyltransferase Ste14
MSDQDTIFRIVLSLLFSLVIVVRRYFGQKSTSIPKEELKQDFDPPRLIAIQGIMLTISNLAIIAHLLNPAWMAWSTINLPVWFGWIGAVLGILSTGLLIWTFLILDRYFFGGIKLRQEHQLVTDSPYRRVRHPMYTAFLAIGFSRVLLSGNLVISGIWLAGTLLVIATRLAAEVQMMLDKFGDAYKAYKQVTGRLIPRVVK